MRIAYHTGDVFALQPERPVDFVVSSLFTHHLRDAEIVKFIRWMEGHSKARLVYQRPASPSRAFLCLPRYGAARAVAPLCAARWSSLDSAFVSEG
jgi:hypothetical protein